VHTRICFADPRFGRSALWQFAHRKSYVSKLTTSFYAQIAALRIVIEDYTVFYLLIQGKASIFVDFADFMDFVDLPDPMI